jgi:hypothetical protein
MRCLGEKLRVLENRILRRMCGPYVENHKDLEKTA